MMIRRKNKRGLLGKIFSFKAFVAMGFLLIIFGGAGLGKEFYREYQIKKEIESLQKEIETLENNNYKLSRLIDYYMTEEYKEAEVRKKLNLKKEGEKVVVIKSESASEDGETKEKKSKEENLPNYRKWWNYFFAGKE